MKQPHLLMNNNVLVNRIFLCMYIEKDSFCRNPFTSANNLLMVRVPIALFAK